MPKYSKLRFGFGHPKSRTTSHGNNWESTLASFEGIVSATTSCADKTTGESAENRSSSTYCSNNSPRNGLKK